MILRRLSLSVLCVLVFAAAPGARQGLPPQATAALDEVLQSAIDAGVPGLSFAVAFQNRIVYSKGFGMADLQHQVPVKTTTAFRTASVAKPLTATAVMILVEEGKLDLDAPIRRYCPAWPEKHPTITARQLLAHQAGVRHYQRQGESTGTTSYFSIEESLALFKDDPLLYEPGTKYSYTTYGYSVLGCAIEGASTMPYEDYMQSRIFRPAGMTRTRLDRHYDVIPDRATGYQILTPDVVRSLPPSARRIAKAGIPYHADLHDTSMKVPGGGLVSTAEDLVRFGIALNTGKLLPKDALEVMWTEQKTAAGESTGYGLGWGVVPAGDGPRRLVHGGNQAGAASAFGVVPDDGAVIALMTNLEDFDTGALVERLTGVLREHLQKAR